MSDQDSHKNLSLVPLASHELTSQQVAANRILGEMVDQSLDFARAVVARVDLDMLVREAKRLLLCKLIGITDDDIRAFKYPLGYKMLAKIERCQQEQGENKMTEENIRVFAFFLQAAIAGHSEAQFLLAEFCYFHGYGVLSDKMKALHWFRKAAEQGNSDAQRALGFIYSGNFIEGLSIDLAEGAKWHRKAAEHGDPGAQNCLGICYAKGQGVPQDYSEAVKWFSKAAEQGEAAAQFSLGYRYENGEGVPKDHSEAVKWYQKAAEQGHANARLALMNSDFVETKQSGDRHAKQ